MDAGEGESRVDAHFVDVCGSRGSPGLSMAGLSFEPTPGAPNVVCGEEYVEFKERIRPSTGWITYADVGQGWRSVKRLARSASEACLAQHAVEVLAGTWASSK
mgnify:CR=1 FL=1